MRKVLLDPSVDLVQHRVEDVRLDLFEAALETLEASHVLGLLGDQALEVLNRVSDGLELRR